MTWYNRTFSNNFHLDSEHGAWIRRRLKFLVMKFQSCACALRGDADACGVLLYLFAIFSFWLCITFSLIYPAAVLPYSVYLLKRL